MGSNSTKVTAKEAETDPSVGSGVNGVKFVINYAKCAQVKNGDFETRGIKDYGDAKVVSCRPGCSCVKCNPCIFGISASMSDRDKERLASMYDQLKTQA